MMFDCGNLQPLKRAAIGVVLLLWISAPIHAYERIVSVGGGITEIIYALGQGDKLVATDTTSYYPDAANALPKVGYLRALSTEGVISLNPDVIIINENAGPPTVIRQLELTGIPLIRLKAANNLNEVLKNVGRLSEKLNCRAEGERLIEQLEQQQNQLAQYLASSTSRQKVMFVLQHVQGTPMVAGRNTAAAGIIELAGGENSIDAFSGYKPLSPEAIIAAAPDIILLASRNGSSPNHQFEKLPGFAQTPAVQKNRIITMDALSLLGFGPRTVMTAKELAMKLAEHGSH